MTASLPDWVFRGENRKRTRAKVEAAQFDPAVPLIPSLPEIVARTSIASPLLSRRIRHSLSRAGVRTLGELAGWTFADFLIDGVGTISIAEMVHVLNALVRLPQDRLLRLSSSTPATVPNLPIEVLASLCFATSVDEEITGLLADLRERNRALKLARWGYGADGPRTLEETGAAFGVTRERARQLVTAKEKEISASGVRLPLASEAVMDLDEVGGMLPDNDYQVLLRYGQVHVSSSALRMLPALAGLGVVPRIAFDARTRLWVTSHGRARLNGTGGSQFSPAARGRAIRYLRRTGAVPDRILDELSPFGREHAISLLEVDGFTFENVDTFALRVPLRDSALLRQCRKALLATGGIEIDELFQGLRRSGFNVSRLLLQAVLEHSGDFVQDAEFVHVSDELPRAGILSPAEATGFALLKEHGGAMSWWDFVDEMKAAGFSGAMAAVVLRKPAVKRLGPSTYGMRGRQYDKSMMDHLDARRRKLMGARVLRSIQVDPTGDVHVTYVLNRFALQGVLPVPRDLRGSSGSWTVQFDNGRISRVRISKGFMWPFRSFVERNRLKPGDELNAVFSAADRRLRIEVTSARPVTGREKPASREDQILRAIFGGDI